MAARVAPLALGPAIADKRRDNGSLVEIKVPFDLRPIGIQKTLEATTDFNVDLFRSIDEVPNKNCTFNINRDTVMKKFNLTKKPTHPGVELNITIDGVEYKEGHYIGSGAYGFVYKFKSGVSPDYNVCLKFQVLRDDTAIINFTKEGIIHYILDKSTKFNTHTDCQYVPEIIKICTSSLNYFLNGIDMRSEINIGIYIVELCKDSYVSAVDDGTADNEHAFMQLSRKLDRLDEYYEFNHCDFHAGNTLYKEIVDPITRSSKYIYLLNDFGFSVLRLKEEGTNKSLVIQTTRYTYNPSRDLTHLVAYLQKFKESFQKIPPRHKGVDYELGTRILNDNLYKLFEDEARQNSNYRDVPHFYVYDWMNTLGNVNPNGIPKTYTEKYNDGANLITGKIYNCQDFPPIAPPAPPAPPAPILNRLRDAANIRAAELYEYIRRNPAVVVSSIIGIGLFAMNNYYGLQEEAPLPQGGYYKLPKLRNRVYIRRRTKKLSRKKTPRKSRRHARR